MDDNLLDELLNAAIEEVSDPRKTLKETDIFNQESNIPTDGQNKQKSNESKLSLVHSGDTDSSDDEDKRNFEDTKYNEYGRNVKHLINTAPPASTSKDTTSWKSKISGKQLSAAPKAPQPSYQDVYTDPIFGIRIVNPLISSALLKERMVGREAVQFAQLKRFIAMNPSEKNWVIAGVVVHKTPVKTSQNGSKFIVWTLTDLKDDIKKISLFLFGNACQEFYKTTIGTVVGILNPTIGEKNSYTQKDLACLSVSKPQTLMIFGQSKDFGTCKSVRKNGEKCTSIVDLSRCEFCLYHIKQEYQKCSSLRSDLQSSFTGGLQALRNKVLGKNEVFYAGKSYTAIPAKRNRKLQQKDENRLVALDQGIANPQTAKKKVKKAAANLEISLNQRSRDLELLERLGGTISNKKQEFNAPPSDDVSIESAKSAALTVIQKLKSTKTPPDKDESVVTNNNHRNTDVLTKTPKLSVGQNKLIDLDLPVNAVHKNRAKVNALEYIKKNGPLKKTDPNAIKTTPTTKRPLDDCDTAPPTNTKKTKIEDNEFLSDRFKKMMATQSIHHQTLLQQHDDEASEKYFNKMEIKERLEEKMVNTFKLPCKAVRCLQCKYTNFSASQHCKDQKHRLRVFDSFKRFFKCGQCGNRIVCLEIVVPTNVCQNCGHGRWERTGMMKEKTATVTNTLSIRGGEQQFVNSIVTDANLNLLVPDD